MSRLTVLDKNMFNVVAPGESIKYYRVNMPDIPGGLKRISNKFVEPTPFLEISHHNKIRDFKEKSVEKLQKEYFEQELKNAKEQDELYNDVVGKMKEGKEIDTTNHKWKQWMEKEVGRQIFQQRALKEFQKVSDEYPGKVMAYQAAKLTPVDAFEQPPRMQPFDDVTPVRPPHNREYPITWTTHNAYTGKDSVTGGYTLGNIITVASATKNQKHYIGKVLVTQHENGQGQKRYVYPNSITGIPMFIAGGGI